MPKKPTLLPKEHGAYAELAFPLVTGLALGVPHLAGISLGLAAVFLFLANEPVAILLGARGKRLKDQLGDPARIRAFFLMGGAACLGFLGIWKGGSAIWPELVFPAAAGGILIPLVLTGRQKTLFGEFVVVTAFATLLLPLAAASGVDPIRAGLAAGVWWLSFALGTLEVHAIKARLKDTARSQWTRWVSPGASGLVVAGALWAALGQASPILGRMAASARPGASGGAGPGVATEAMRLIPPAAAALLIPALAIFVLSLAKVHPKRLKRVGWTLVGMNTLALILLL